MTCTCEVGVLYTSFYINRINWIFRLYWISNFSDAITVNLGYKNVWHFIYRYDPRSATLEEFMWAQCGDTQWQVELWWRRHINALKVAWVRLLALRNLWNMAKPVYAPYISIAHSLIFVLFIFSSGNKCVQLPHVWHWMQRMFPFVYVDTLQSRIQIGGKRKYKQINEEEIEN